jgi:hypothetical protein
MSEKPTEHIPTQQLAAIAVGDTSFSPDEFQHFRNCSQCIDQFREFVQKDLRDAKARRKPKQS